MTYVSLCLPISVQTLPAARNRKLNSNYFKGKKGLYWLGNQGVQLDPEALTMLWGPSLSPFLSPALPCAGSVTQACSASWGQVAAAVLEVDCHSPKHGRKMKALLSALLAHTGSE